MLKCPVCGNTEFPGQREGQDIKCPVLGCGRVIRAWRPGDVRRWEKPAGGAFQWMENFHPSALPAPAGDAPFPGKERREGRPPRVFRWAPAHQEDWIREEPLAAFLIPGDEVWLSEGQAVRFCAGGMEAWIKKGGSHSLCYDRRGEGEIIQARLLGEDIPGTPPMIHTGLTFVSKEEYSCAVPVDRYIHIHPGLGLKPSFEIRLHVEREDLLISRIKAGIPARDQVLSAIAKGIGDGLEGRLTEWNAFNAATNLPAAERQFSDRGWMEGLLNALLKAAEEAGAMFGVMVTQIEPIAWHMHSGFCQACGAPVEERDRRCENGHPLHRCPLCRQMIVEGQCPSGHPVLYCPACGQYVAAHEGACALHRHIRLE